MQAFEAALKAERFLIWGRGGNESRDFLRLCGEVVGHGQAIGIMDDDIGCFCIDMQGFGE